MFCTVKCKIHRYSSLDPHQLTTPLDHQLYMAKVLGDWCKWHIWSKALVIINVRDREERILMGNDWVMTPILEL